MRRRGSLGVGSLALALCALVGCTPESPSTARWPDRSEPIAGTPPLGYVTNNGEDTVSVVELSTLREVARRPVGFDPVDPEAPHHLALDPSHGWVWVGLSNVGLVSGGGLHGGHGGGLLPSYVQRLSLSDLVADSDVRVDPNLGDIVLTTDERIVTTHFDLATALDVASRGAPVEEGYGALYVLDGASMHTLAHVALCTAPHGAAITRDGALAAVACYGDDAVAFVDLTVTPPAVLARVPAGPGPGTVSAPRYGPYAIAFSPDESFVLVGVLDGQAVRRIEVATRTETTTAAVVLDGRAFFGSFDPAGARYWVATQGRDSVTRIDVATGALDGRHGFSATDCVSPHEAVYVASLDRVFVVCEGDHASPGALVAVDPDTLDVVGRLELGVYPDVLRVVEGP
jgi:DNA-binding beta-propeller fold protein YncE